MAKDVLIYSKPDCPHCTNAKSLFKSKGIAFRELNYLDLSDTQRDELNSITDGYRSLPMIFIANKFYRGFNEIRELDLQGRLDEVLGLENRI